MRLRIDPNEAAVRWRERYIRKHGQEAWDAKYGQGAREARVRQAGGEPTRADKLVGFLDRKLAAHQRRLGERLDRQPIGTTEYVGTCPLSGPFLGRCDHHKIYRAHGWVAAEQATMFTGYGQTHIARQYTKVAQPDATG